ncbi:MAG: DUF2637 domain-containing protein [Porphyromonadaceae bacterium]|nr:DUF2637 domain-containing protein [Porphyromonadaceae bacterium]
MKTQNGFVLLIAGVLAFFSFAISYQALQTLALNQGINPAALFPVIIDGVMILSLVYRLYGPDKEIAQAVMLLYVCLSVSLNAIGHGTILGAIMGAVAPISMLVTSELAASMIQAPVKKTGKARDSKGRFVKSEVNVDES